jgi:hypothetical protein
MSLANNYFGIATGQPVPDEYGISVYRRLWSPLVRRYVTYPFPAWYYAARSGLMQLIDGRPSLIHELQAEPWGPADITTMSIAEQNKSMNATSLKQRVSFAEATGMRSINLWGAEWWYYRKVKLHDPSLWNAAQQIYADTNTQPRNN